MVLNVKFDAFFWREERWNIEFDAFFWREEMWNIEFDAFFGGKRSGTFT